MPFKEFEIADAGEETRFTVGGEKFTGVPANRLPGNALVRYTEALERGRVYEANITFVRDCLTGDSADRFLNRMDSKDNPITLKTLGDILNWLVGEVYGKFSSSDDEGKDSAPATASPTP